MRTINLQTVYQLVFTALLLGACLGLLGQRLPLVASDALPAFDQWVPATPASIAPSISTAKSTFAPQGQDVTTSKNDEASVQVEVEVHTRGNANAQARALGPSDTTAQTNPEGEGDGRSAAYSTAPEAPAWQPTVQSSETTAGSLPTAVPTQPKATVKEDLVNLRSRPALTSAVVGTAARGESFTIIGRDPTNTWWLLCCEGNDAWWVYSSVVDVTGDLQQVAIVQPPVAEQITTSAAVAVPTPTMVPPLPTASPPPQDEFMLAEQAQFEERIVPRLFLYIYQGAEGLSGYTVRIHKDGTELPVVKTSVAGLPGFTWPIPTDRQRYTNLKIEFPHIKPEGIWEIQLLDGSGRAVGPTASFRLEPDEPNQEMYLMYRKQ